MPQPELVSRVNGIHVLTHKHTRERNTVILCHGINADLHEDATEDKPGLFDLIVANLWGCGFGTCRFDFRGHGLSVSLSNGFSVDTARQDFLTIYDYLYRSGFNPRYAVACSLGTTV